MVEKQPDLYRSYSVPNQDEVVVPLTYLVAVLRRRALPVLLFIAVATAATFLVSRRLPAVYESTVTLDLERQTPQATFGQDAFLTTQLNIIQSDAVLRPVVQKYKLEGYDLTATDHQGKASEQEIPVLSNLRVSHPPNSFLILIAYRSHDAEQAANIVNSIADSYLRDRLSIGALSSQVAEQQLAEVKDKMERSAARLQQLERGAPDGKSSGLSSQLMQVENELVAVQAERDRRRAAQKLFREGTLDAVQASPHGESLRPLFARMAAEQARVDKLSAQYTPKHPEFTKAANQLKETQDLVEQTRKMIAAKLADDLNEIAGREAGLGKRRTELKAELQRLGVQTVDSNAIRHEADADRVLYQDMLRRVKDPGVSAKTPENSIRILDRGRIPRSPVSPDLRMNILLGLVVSTVFALGAAVVLELVDDTVRDPSQASRLFRLDILGTLPTLRRLRKEGALKQLLIGVTTARRSVRFLNSVETLHNSMLPAGPSSQERVRTMLVVGSGTGDGATTISAALAVVHARQRRRTLLIDANLRHEGVGETLGMGLESGFSDVLTAQASWREALDHSKDWPELDVLSAGGGGVRALDLLALKLPALLAGAAAEYDLVVIDAAPLSPFPESLQIAPLVDAVAVVCAAGHSKNARVQSALVSLTRVKAKVAGLVVNRVRVHG